MDTRAIGVVFGKEVKDGRRDKRAVMSAFLFPVLAPILVYGMLSFMISLKNKAEQIVVPVIGIENAPAFIRWLKERNVKVEPFEGDPKEAVKNKKIGILKVKGTENPADMNMKGLSGDDISRYVRMLNMQHQEGRSTGRSHS